MSRSTKRSIFILIFGNFLVCLAIGLVIPVTPFIKNTYGYTTTQMGLMSSLFAFAQFIASPIVGRISDKIGRKPVMVTGLALFMVSEIIFALANHLFWFDVSRIIGGLSAAMFVPTSMAMAADLTNSLQRAKVIGWISAAFSGGLILGPGIGGMLASITYKTPFWVAASLGLASTIFTLIFLPNVVSKKDDEEEHASHKKTKISSILTFPMVILFFMILVSAFGLQGFESIYSIYVNQVFKFTLNTIALVLTLNGIISLFLQVILFDRLVRKIGEVNLIAVCFLLSALCVGWITIAQTQIEVIVATLVIFSAFDLLRPAITTLLTKFGKTNQGLINGLNMSLTSVGNVIGPIMSGMLMDMNTHYPYQIAAIILLISFLITLFVRKVIHTAELPN